MNYEGLDRMYMMDTEILHMYIDWYNNNPEITREELYRSYYGADSYLLWIKKGNLDKFLTR